MCVVSMVGDHYTNTYPKWPEWTKIDNLPTDNKKLDRLTKRVEEMVDLLKQAKKYDMDNDEPDCQTDEKLEKLKSLCALFDIDLDQVFNDVVEKYVKR